MPEVNQFFHKLLSFFYIKRLLFLESLNYWHAMLINLNHKVIIIIEKEYHVVK